MKTRARIVSGLAPLAALAVLFLAPLAEASLTRASTAERAIEAPALTLAAPTPEPSEFSLFEGHEIAAAAAEPERAPSFHPLAAVSLLSKDEAEPPLVSAEPLRFQETRIGVFDFLGSRIIGVERELSLDLQWGSGRFGLEISEGIGIWLSQDPLGDVDSPNLYGFVGARPHEMTDPLGLLGIEDVPGIVGDTLLGILDPRNAWTNAQRGFGGALGAGKFVAKTGASLALLTLDSGALGPALPGAAQRNEARAKGIVDFVKHPVDTIVNAHSKAFDTILEHEQKGQYVRSGIEAGELGVADAAAAYGAAGAVRSIAGAVSRAVSFEGIAAGGIEAYSADVARMTGRGGGVPPQLRAGQIFEAEQLEGLGIPKETHTLRPSVEQTNSAAFRVIVGEPKFTPGGLPRGTIFDASQGGFLEIKGGASVLRSTYQLRLQTYFSLKMRVPFTLRSTRPIEAGFDAWLTRWGVNVEAP
jgi:hypothetical protein